eukprot:jgi/Bigna1/145988/aug1.107_g20696
MRRQGRGGRACTAAAADAAPARSHSFTILIAGVLLVAWPHPDTHSDKLKMASVRSERRRTVAIGRMRSLRGGGRRTHSPSKGQGINIEVGKAPWNRTVFTFPSAAGSKASCAQRRKVANESSSSSSLHEFTMDWNGAAMEGADGTDNSANGKPMNNVQYDDGETRVKNGKAFELDSDGNTAGSAGWEAEDYLALGISPGPQRRKKASKSSSTINGASKGEGVKHFRGGTSARSDGTTQRGNGAATCGSSSDTEAIARRVGEGFQEAEAALAPRLQGLNTTSLTNDDFAFMEAFIERAERKERNERRRREGGGGGGERDSGRRRWRR